MTEAKTWGAPSLTRTVTGVIQTNSGLSMTLADRIVILRGGNIEQVGTPDEVYNKPASIFVGGFVGSPAMNFARAKTAGGNLVFANGDHLALSALDAGGVSAAEGREFIVGIRPEHFVPASSSAADLSGQVQVVEPLGSDTLVHFALGDATLTARMPPQMRPRAGERLTIGLDPSKIHLFDAATERAIH